MQPSIHPARILAAARSIVALATTASTLIVCTPAGGAEPRPLAGATRQRVVVDHAVTPAGGLHCRHCGEAACRLHGGHLAACRDGLCAPHCPVRPSEYGFYRTQWRRWPGEGVVPASATDAVTPVSPPASQVPSVEEESPRPPAEDAPPPTDDAKPTADDASPPASPAPAPAGRANNTLPTDPVPEAAGATEPEMKAPAAPPGPPVPPTPPGEPPVVPVPADEGAGLLDRSESPSPEPEAPVAAGAMRYPAPIGRSLAAGASPWKLDRSAGQREADSARGL